MKQEFDSYIDNYRRNCDRVLIFSGESSNSIALYKAQKLQEWFPHLQDARIRLLDFGCGDGVMTAYVSKAFVNAKIIGPARVGDKIKLTGNFPHCHRRHVWNACN